MKKGNDGDQGNAGDSCFSLVCSKTVSAMEISALASVKGKPLDWLVAGAI